MAVSPQICGLIRRLCPRLRRLVKLFAAADPLRCRCRPEQMPVLPRNPRSFGKWAAAELALRRPSNWPFHRQIGGIHGIVSRRLVAIALCAREATDPNMQFQRRFAV